MTPDLAKRFEAEFGEPPEWEASAPGRVNLIGEHTDYNQGWVFPAAIDRRTRVLARRSDRASRVRSLQMREVAEFHVESPDSGEAPRWSEFIRGIAWAASTHCGHTVSNVSALVDSDVPLGSGLSSSAALEMAFACLWNQMDDLGLSATELAWLGPIASEKFTGVRCGVMDQWAAVAGRAAHALLVDTRDLATKYVPFPGEWTLLVCHTGRNRELANSAYNLRREECEQAAALLGVAALRDVAPPELESARTRLPDVLFRRARHVVTENARCIEFGLALEARDGPTVGRLMTESHESLRSDYEVSGPELDLMAELCRLQPGCIGARMTGAGFGGACVAIFEAPRDVGLYKGIAAAYRARCGLEASIWTCAPGAGAKSGRYGKELVASVHSPDS
jgi:galactokinase